MLIKVKNSQNLFLSPMADGPIRFVGNLEDGLNIQNVSRFGRDFSTVRVPYAFKLLLQEIQTMNVVMRIITEDNVDQVTSLSYSKNYKEISGFSSLDEIKSTIKSSTGPSKISTQLLEQPMQQPIQQPMQQPMQQETTTEYKPFYDNETSPEYNTTSPLVGEDFLKQQQEETLSMEGGEKDIIKIDTEDVKLETDDIINLINNAEKENTITLLTDVQNDEPMENQNEETKEIKTIN